jgi:NADP-reducing hydrogenase subunit HndB
MKSLKELEAIRQSTIEALNLRGTKEDAIRIVVGMATCGIAAGARPVMMELVDQINTRGLKNVTVSQTGCIGVCRLEPIVEVYEPGKEKVTYVKVNKDVAAKIIAQHIVNGQLVAENLIGNFE